MRSRMTDAQLAALRAKSDTGNTLNALAQAANGHGVTRVQAREAEAALIEAVGARKADRLKEDALVRSGARPKGVRRFFG
ncbi:hypothetical protein ACGFJC_12995 [Nonomuraea fuscirosea]|uniref:hypothetical protein n=1 Tax=Nonomuraea fuscirosea TaxID=1291556 RepID=UPI003493AA7E